MFRADSDNKSDPKIKAPFSFWKGVVGNLPVIDQNKAHIDWLLSTTQFQGQCERMWVDKHTYIQSSRLNDADRLISTTIKFNGKSYLLVLEEALNHDYQKCKFRQPGVLRDYLANNEEEILRQISHIEESDIEQKTPDKKTKITLPRIEYENNKLIELDSKQSEALSTSLPLIVSGAAGSGKTTVAFAQLIDRIASAQPGEKLLYVAKSKALVTQMQNRFNAHNLHPPGVTVQFLTYDELLHSQHPALANLEKATDDDFTNWFKESYLPKLRNELKAKNTQKNKKKNNKPSLPFNLEEAGKIYEEFRTFSAYENEQYYHLGKDHCHYHSKPEKENIAKAYEAYTTHLKSIKKWDPAFEVIKSDQQYDFVAVDEAQDLSNLQLKQLIALARHEQICFFMDTHQNLFDSQSKRPFLLNELGKGKFAVTHIQLPTVYRCPRNIAAFAKRLIDLKNTVARGISDKLEHHELIVNEDSKNEGTVTWHEAWDENLIQHIKTKYKATEFAIITEPEYREEAEKLFGTVLVFSPEEIKGLEYPNIVCYRLFDNNEFKEANHVLDGIPPEQYGKVTHKAKEGESNRDFFTTLNRPFTAVTRSSNNLYVFQKKHHHIKHISDYLDPTPVEEKPTPSPVPSIEPEIITTREDWKETVETLIANGNITQARKIFIREGLGTAAEFNDRTNTKPVSSVDRKPELPKKPSVEEKPNTVENKQEKIIPTNHYDYVCKFYHSFSSANLLGLLKHKNAMHYLFGRFKKPLNNANCLFDAIFKDKDKSNLFFKNDQANLLFVEKLKESLFSLFSIDEDKENAVAPFCVLADSTKDFDIVLLSLLSSKKIHQRITAELLCTFFKLPNEDVKVPLLYILLKNSKLHKTLLDTLNYLPNLAKTLTKETLCTFRHLPDNKGVESVFFLLCAIRPLHEAPPLFKLFKKHHDIVKLISAESLFSLRKKSGEKLPTSALHHLLLYPEYYEFVRALLNQPSILEELNKHPELKEKVSEYLITYQEEIPRSDEEKHIAESRYDYILNFYNNFTPKKLLALLKSKDAMLYLFGGFTKPINNETCLYDAFQNNPALATPFSNALYNDVTIRNLFITKLSENLFTPLSIQGTRNATIPICQISGSRPPLQKLTHSLLQTYPIPITAEGLCTPSKVPGKHKYRNLLYNLAGNEDLLSLLPDIFKRNPSIAAEISGKALCLLNHNPNDADSALYWLTCEDNLPLLKSIFKAQPSIAKEITSEALFSLANYDETYQTSPLNELLESETGRSIIYDIFTQQPAILKLLYGKTLFATKNGSGETSALFQFIKHPSMHIFLTQLLKEQPDLVTDIATSDSLLKCLTISHLQQEFTSDNYSSSDSLLLSWSREEDTRKILINWLIIHPQEIKKVMDFLKSKNESIFLLLEKELLVTERFHYINSLLNLKNPSKEKFIELLHREDAMLLLFGSYKGFRDNACLFDLLLREPERYQSFASTITESPYNLIFRNKLEPVIFVPLSMDDANNAITPFTRLTTNKNQKLLKEFFQTYPISNMTAEILSTPTRGLRGELTTPLYSLTTLLRPYLVSIFKTNLSLASGITANALSMMFQTTNGRISTLLPLTYNNTLFILERIFHTQESIAKEITAEALFSEALLTYADQKMRVSALNMLSSTKAGRGILRDIFTAQPILVEHLTANILFFAEGPIKAPILTRISSAPNLHPFLVQVFKNQPEMLPRTLEMLAKVTEPTDPNTDTPPSLLYYITKNDCDFSLINLMVENEPQLLKQITLEQLQKTFTPEDYSSIDSVLDSWLKHEKGIDLLNRWLAFHPENTALINYHIECNKPLEALTPTQQGLTFFSGANETTLSPPTALVTKPM